MSQQNHFCPNFAHNVNFLGKLGNFPEIIFGDNGSLWCIHLWNRTEILIDCHINQGVILWNPSITTLSTLCTQWKFFWKTRNFPAIIFGQNSRVWCVDLWNKTEILIDWHIIIG